MRVRSEHLRPARVAAWPDATFPLGVLHDRVCAGAGARGLVATDADLGAGSGGESAPAVRTAGAALTAAWSSGSRTCPISTCARLRPPVPPRGECGWRASSSDR
jgi:hypothetical protein